MDIVDAEALYPMVSLSQRCSLASRREGGIIGRKSPTFVDFQQADSENFGQGLRSVLRKHRHLGYAYPDTCCAPQRNANTGATSGLQHLHDEFRVLRKREKSVCKFDSVTFECQFNLIEPFYLIKITVIHRGFGVVSNFEKSS